MRILELDNFILEEYSPLDPIHQQVITEINDMKSSQIFLGDLNYAILRILQRRETNPYNIPYIAFFGEDAIGYISLSFIDSTYQISYGIRPKFQNQYLGSSLLFDFSDKLFAIYSDIDKHCLKIDEKNIGSIKLATKAGYEKEDRDIYTQRRI